MKTTTPASPSSTLAGTVLLALLTSVGPAAAAAPRMDISDDVIEIRGGDWTLRYGTYSVLEKRFALAGGDRAWLAHESWLRLIDTTKGTVIGRWRFPGFIVDLAPSGSELHLTFQWRRYGATGADRTTWTLDPDDPVVPNWPSEEEWSLRAPEREASFPGAPHVRSLGPSVSREQARALIPELENAVRRDPLSPWLQFGLWRLLCEMEDPRAQSVLEGALGVPGTDFTEWFPMSDALERLGEQELARDVFVRGYRDFLERGNDPRLFHSLVSRSLLYSNEVSELESGSLERHEELVERLYRLAPYARGADIAWQHFADYLEQQGRPESAALWAARAREARDNNWDRPGARVIVLLDRSLLWIRASLGAAALFVIALFARSFERQPRCSVLGIDSWTRAERLGFSMIVATGWIAVGLLGEIREVLPRLWAPFAVTTGGSLAGPSSVAYFEKLPPTPERDLLLATAYHHSGMLAEAEPLYRSAPAFPESWNNLGALLAAAGREEEARRAFEKALELDPSLSEAKWNLGGPPQDLWTEAHQRSRPSSPMLTPPRPERVYRARLGGSERRLLFHALAGPFAGPYERSDHWGRSHLWNRGLADAQILFAVLALSSFVLLLAPCSDETPRSGSRYWLWETFVPGTSRAWTIFGGVLLVAWCYLLLQAAYHLSLGTPYATLYDELPGLGSSYRNYGTPITSPNPLRHINPHAFWLYGSPVLLFAVNGFLVWRSRRRGEAAR